MYQVKTDTCTCDWLAQHGSKKTSSSPEYRGRQESTIYAYNFFIFFFVFFLEIKEEDCKESSLTLMLKRKKKLEEEV